MNDSNDYHYLEDSIFNRKRQIMCMEDKYMDIQKKSGHLSKLLGIIFFVPTLLLLLNMHYVLLLNFGIPSLFISPASVMVLALITGIGAKIGEKIYDDKIGTCEETIQRLKDEREQYKKQLEKVKKRRITSNKEEIVSPETIIKQHNITEEIAPQISGKPKVLLKSTKKQH